ncbi:MAG TPA: recombination mediator RecR [Planctomycetota bacterium]|nr:recombination mediator RecR [Planctomycetota bacterium]
MPGFPEELQRLIGELGRLPGVGQKSAERLAFFLLKGEAADAYKLADAIRAARDALRPCRDCFNVSAGERCAVCADPARDRGAVMVVEHPRDLMAFEAMGRWKGVYHVLLGRLAPHEGQGPEHTSAAALEARVRKGGVREVVLATNPDAEGDAAALYLERRLAGAPGVTVTRLARGLGTGGSIEYAGTEVLAEALALRRPSSGKGPAHGAPEGA